MYDKLTGRVFLCKITNDSVVTLLEVEIIAAIPGEYFNENQFNVYIQQGSNSPGAAINPKSNYLTFLVRETISRKIHRVTEYECCYDVTDLTQDEIRSKIAQMEADDRELKLQREIGLIGMDKHFLKCVDVGLSHKEAYKNLIEVIKTRLDNLEDEKRKE